MVPVTPNYIVAIFDKDNAGIVFVIRIGQFGIGLDKLNRFIFYFPVNAVLAAPRVNIHVPRRIITAENTRILALERNNGAVKNTVRTKG